MELRIKQKQNKTKRNKKLLCCEWRRGQKWPLSLGRQRWHWNARPWKDSLCPMKLILLTIASGVRFHFPHFRGKEITAQRGKDACPRSHSQWPNQASKGGLTGLHDLFPAHTDRYKHVPICSVPPVTRDSQTQKRCSVSVGGVELNWTEFPWKPTWSWKLMDRWSLVRALWCVSSPVAPGESGRQTKCFYPSGGHKVRLLEGINNIQGIPLEQ